jgi:hypothetical protein
MRNHLLGFLVPMAGILAIANPASALTGTFGSFSYTTQPSSGGYSVSLNQINSSVEQLTSVTFNLSGTTTFYVDALNEDTQAESVGVKSASLNTDVAVNNLNPSLATITPTYTTATPSDTTLPGPDFTPTLVLSGATASDNTTTTITDSSSLSLFQGTGQFSLTVNEDFSSFLATIDNTDTSISTSPDYQTTTTGTLSVTYTYTPVPFEFSPNQLGFGLFPLLLAMRVIKKRIVG